MSGVRRKAEFGIQRAHGCEFGRGEEAERRTPGETHNADAPCVDCGIGGQEFERAEDVRERIDRRPRPPIDSAETSKCCRPGRHATRCPHVDDKGCHARFSESRDIIRLGAIGQQPAACVHDDHRWDGPNRVSGEIQRGGNRTRRRGAGRDWHAGGGIADFIRFGARRSRDKHHDQGEDSERNWLEC